MNRKRKRKAAEATAISGEATPQNRLTVASEGQLEALMGRKEETAVETQTLVFTYYFFLSDWPQSYAR